MNRTTPDLLQRLMSRQFHRLTAARRDVGATVTASDGEARGVLFGGGCGGGEGHTMAWRVRSERTRSTNDDRRADRRQRGARPQRLGGVGACRSHVVGGQALCRTHLDRILGAQDERTRHHRIRDVEREVERQNEYEPAQHDRLILRLPFRPATPSGGEGSRVRTAACGRSPPWRPPCRSLVCRPPKGRRNIVWLGGVFCLRLVVSPVRRSTNRGAARVAARARRPQSRTRRSLA